MNDMNYTADQPQVPLHRKIAENLSSQVINGKLKPGEKLPSERQIAGQYHASRATVRTALQHLEQEGLISRRERRSAVVAIRKNMAPHLRIACTNTRLMRLMTKLTEMQLMPPRCQFQLLDPDQPGVVSQLTSQPATAADLVITDLEMLYCLREPNTKALAIPDALINEAQIPTAIERMCTHNGKFLAVPLGLSPMVMYFNRSIFAESGRGLPHFDWQWHDLEQIARDLTYNNRYGLQFKPSFSHLATIMASRGSEYYQADGRLAINSSSEFEPTLRFIYDLLHHAKACPILPKSGPIDLFAQRRAAMALGSFEDFRNYKRALGDDLEVGIMPGPVGLRPLTSGLAAVVLTDQDSFQPVEDLMRSLLSHNTQMLVAEAANMMPVRNELLNSGTLQSMDISESAAQVFLQKLNTAQACHLPQSPEYKHKVETLMTEMWLGLDNIDSICHRMKELG